MGDDTTTPETITPETFGTDDGPTTAYVPTARMSRDDFPPVTLRALGDGHMALTVFTDLDHLVQGCGPDQPWVSIDTEHVETVRYHTEADVVLWDPVMPPHLWQHGEHDDDAIPIGD